VECIVALFFPYLSGEPFLSIISQKALEYFGERCVDYDHASLRTLRPALIGLKTRRPTSNSRHLAVLRPNHRLARILEFSNQRIRLCELEDR